MSFKNFAIQLQLASEALTATREEESIQIALELRALIRNRVQNDKVDANGATFGGYSQAVVPKTFYFGRSLSQGAEDIIDSGPYFQSYTDFREANNLPTEAKDFTFSGDMWRSIGVVDVQSDDTTTRVEIGGQTDEAAAKLAFNTARSGAILEASEQEVQFVTEAHEERVFGIIEQFFGQ